MITEDYVSYETAKLLKEKGFNEHCHTWQRENENINYCDIPLDYSDMFEEHNEYLVPTYQMAMKWLREVHSLEIYPYHDFTEDNDSWWFEIIRFNSSYAEHESDSIYHTYEEACEDAIKYCLENLI